MTSFHDDHEGEHAFSQVVNKINLLSLNLSNGQTTADAFTSPLITGAATSEATQTIKVVLFGDFQKRLMFIK